jgi:hypothetical protein
MSIVTYSQLKAMQKKRSMSQEVKEQLQHKLADMIRQDIEQELQDFNHHVEAIKDIYENRFLFKTYNQLSNHIASLENLSKLFRTAFDKKDINYNSEEMMSYRQLIISSISQKKYRDLLDKINSL